MNIRPHFVGDAGERRAYARKSEAWIINKSCAVNTFAGAFPERIKGRTKQEGEGDSVRRERGREKVRKKRNTRREKEK